MSRGEAIRIARLLLDADGLRPSVTKLAGGWLVYFPEVDRGVRVVV